MNNPNGFSSVCIWSAEDGKLRRVTDEQFDAGNPRLGSQGRLPLLPQRPRLRAADVDAFEFNFATDRRPGSTPWRCARTWRIRSRPRATR